MTDWRLAIAYRVLDEGGETRVNESRDKRQETGVWSLET